MDHLVGEEAVVVEGAGNYFRTIYNDCRHSVGTQFNRAFVPDALSASLAEKLHLSPDAFLPAFEMQEPVMLYPDAIDFILKIKEDPSIDTILFTQGEVFDQGWFEGDHRCGFQNQKVWASGIPAFIGQDAIARTEALGFPFVLGSFDKVNFDTLQPILQYVQDTGRPVHYFDDCLYNLEMLHGYFTDYKRHIELNWIVRDGMDVRGLTFPVNYITSFENIDVSRLSKSLTLIDFDGTLSVREDMREKLYRKAWIQAEKLLSGKG